MSATVLANTLPQYARAETFDAWIKINSELVAEHWRTGGGDYQQPGAYAELLKFAEQQFANTSEGRQS